MKTKLADVLADCGRLPGQDKHKYVKIGTAFSDGDRISIKIDSLPLDGSGWEGWCNLFADKFKKSEPPPDDSDIPF